MLWGKTAYCVKLSDKDLSRYSNKIESISYHSLTKNVMSRFSELAPHHGGQTAGTDMVRRNNVTVTLCTVAGRYLFIPVDAIIRCHWTRH